MFVIVWEFRVSDDRRQEFERVYGPEGEWVRLFRTGEGYGGSELLVDVGDPGRYLTIDRWASPSAYEAFRLERLDDYEALDARTEDLTVSERQLGSFGETSP